ncbi:hypothetical protein OH146_00450 [Salinibacterium sp. SYSU T00001]|uniref:FUSC family protein n=1 Tax=Homoserinimonas sedimenticola TaxID=2986805 RepID=UPI0022357215|nr:hypothetical protein [Salinibacterium sedimenticola]MCW4384240.1 hypothetical protein [Salinibacterium sedimenticola]
MSKAARSLRLRASGFGHWIARTVKPAFRAGRLILAGKTALAAGIAWPVAHIVPGVDEYSYYAPMGALIVMMPTVMGSLRSTLQTVIGLALGVLLAWAVILSPFPLGPSVALAVGLGVVLGGLGGLGAGRDWLPIAALFVLVIGGSDAEGYSIAYLVQTGLGMLVGVIVNVTIMPPLWLNESSMTVGRLRRRLAEILSDLGDRIREGIERDDLPQQLAEFEASLREAESVVADAADSQRFNPRSRRHPYDAARDARDLDALDRLAAHVRSVVDDAELRMPDPEDVPAHDGENLADIVDRALQRLAHLVQAWDTNDDVDPALAKAHEAVDHLDEATNTTRSASGPLPPAPGLESDVRHMLAIIERRLRVDQSAEARAR